MAKGVKDFTRKEAHIQQLEDFVSDESAEIEVRLRAMKQLADLTGIKPPEGAGETQRMSQEELKSKIQRLLPPLIKAHLLEEPGLASH